MEKGEVVSRFAARLNTQAADRPRRERIGAADAGIDPNDFCPVIPCVFVTNARGRRRGRSGSRSRRP